MPDIVQKADLDDVADCRAVIAAVDRAFEGVDVSINAARLADRGLIFDTTEERFDELSGVNIKGPFFLISTLR